MPWGRRLRRITNFLGGIMIGSVIFMYVNDRATPVFLAVVIVFVPWCVADVIYSHITTGRELKKSTTVTKAVTYVRDNGLPSSAMAPEAQEELMIVRARRILAEKKDQH